MADRFLDSLSWARLTWPLFTSGNPAASLTPCQLSIPFHPYFSSSIAPFPGHLAASPHTHSLSLSLSPNVLSLQERCAPTGIPRKQRGGFRLPNCLDNESAATGTTYRRRIENNAKSHAAVPISFPRVFIFHLRRYYHTVLLPPCSSVITYVSLATTLSRRSHWTAWSAIIARFRVVSWKFALTVRAPAAV